LGSAQDAGRGAGDRGLRGVQSGAEEDESVIGPIVRAQREEVAREIAGRKAEAGEAEEEIEELVGSVPF
jgi:hypothetical protein